MKLKQIIVLGVIFIVLLGVLFAKKIFVKPEIENSEYKNLEISFDPSSIYAIEIKKAQDKDVFRMEKKGDEWTIPSQWNIKAKKKKVEDLLNELRTLQVELRSSSKELLSDYGISENEAFSISLLDKALTPQQKLLLGMKRPSAEGSFLRKSTSNNVYLVNKDIFAMIGIYGEPKESTISSNDWADMAILKFDTEKIDSVKVSKSDADRQVVAVDIKKTLDPEKKLMNWISAESKPLFDLDATKIKNFLRKINDLYAAKAVAPEGENYGFDKPFIHITLGSADGPTELMVGNLVAADKTDRYLKTSRGYVYIVSQYTIKELDIDMSKFFIENPLRVDKDKVQSITVIADNKRIIIDKELIEKNIDYINKLKTFAVEKLLFDEKYAKGIESPAPYSLKIAMKDGVTLTLDVKKEEGGRYVGQVSERPGVFVINKNIFEKVFTGLDAVKLTADQPQKK